MNISNMNNIFIEAIEDIKKLSNNSNGRTIINKYEIFNGNYTSKKKEILHSLIQKLISSGKSINNIKEHIKSKNGVNINLTKKFINNIQGQNIARPLNSEPILLGEKLTNEEVARQLLERKKEEYRLRLARNVNSFFAEKAKVNKLFTPSANIDPFNEELQKQRELNAQKLQKQIELNAQKLLNDQKKIDEEKKAEIRRKSRIPNSKKGTTNLLGITKPPLELNRYKK